MLKMLTFFQGLPGQHPGPGTPDFPGSPPALPSTSEAESETSMSEASSEDPVPPPEAGVTPDLEEDGAAKKKKKKGGLATVFSIFTKGKKKKKKGQPRSAEPEAGPESGAESESELGGPLPTAEELKAALEQGRLEAARELLRLERALAAAAAGGAGAEELVRRQSKVEALYALLRAQVLGLLRRPLAAAPERLRQALAVVAQQEREDRRAARGPGAAALARTRPRGWLQLWRGGVAEGAAERLDAWPAAEPGRSRAEGALVHMGRTLRADLEAVVERLKPLFPAEFDVVATYARSYHEHFARRLSALAASRLCERDTYLLLLWVQRLYPSDILNSAKLAGELQALNLGRLLPPEHIRVLEANFLFNEVASVKNLMARALELESQRWAQDVAPHRLVGRCHSELAIDIIQIVAQGQTKAENITSDLGVQIKQMLLVELAALLRSYQRTFDEFLERGKPLKNYRANVIANINNCLSFRTTMEQKWQVPQELRNHLLDPLSELRVHGYDILLQSLFVDLKPLFRRFTQTRWEAAVETLEEIVATVGGRLPEFAELQDCFREELMEAIHLYLVKEYIIRLSKRRVILKTAEQQKQLAKHILDNARVIQSFCAENGSSAAWLHPALPKLAEIIRLQDLSDIKLEVATYASGYPDFSKGHLNAILAIKGNLSSSDARSIRDILDISTGAQEPARSLFSLIKVS